MKTPRLLLVFSLFLMACSSPETDQPADLLFDCMTSAFEAQGFQLADELKALEKDLINKGILENGETVSIYKAFEQLAADQLPSFSLKPDDHRALFQVKPDEYFSAACWDSLVQLEKDFPHSKVYALQKGMDELRMSGAMSLPLIAEKELSILEVADLNHCYYSFSMLMQLLYVADIETGLIPPPGD